MSATVHELDEARVSSLLDAGSGIQVLEGALRRCDSGPGLLALLGRFAAFDSAFGPALLCLVSEISRRTWLFREPDETLSACADRSSEVAGFLFQAAIDEFGDWSHARLPTRRRLAQVLLKTVTEFFEIDPAHADEALQLDLETRHAMAAVHAGYGGGVAVDKERIFRALGFHLAGEQLAESEFHAIHDCLCERWPELRIRLSEKSAVLFGRTYAPMLWIQRGTEAQYAAFASLGAAYALRCCTGTSGVEQRWVHAGIAEYVAMHQRFMTSLAQGG